jgi:symplekin
MGGQVKIDTNMLQDMMMRVDGSTPSNHVVAILKPAALAFLEVESTVPKPSNEENTPSFDFIVDRTSIDFDFYLSQKSYALTINALSAIAMNRPAFFYEAAVTLAQRAKNPPQYREGGEISKPAAIVIASQLRASCLTLLRNALSITSKSSGILHSVLVTLDMELQADKALQMARQANELKTASRSARNQAKMFYEWDASEVDRRSSKRQKETDDALAKMRAAKRQRGLGAGIQLPSSMTDAIELVLINLENLPSKPPSMPNSSVSTKAQVSLDYLIDAIMTNGASLLRDEGRWYDRNGGGAWIVDFQSKENFKVSPSLFEALESINGSSIKKESIDENVLKRNELFVEQSRIAASDAVCRILSSTVNCRSKSLATLGNQLAARLSFILKGAEPLGRYKESHSMAKESVTSCSSITSPEDTGSVESFVEEFPLVASSIATIATANPDFDVSNNAHSSNGEVFLNEALMHATSELSDSSNNSAIREYDLSLNLLIASTVHASQLAKDKPNDLERKKAAAQSAGRLQKDLSTVPRLTPSSLKILCALCDIEDITKKSKSPNESIAVVAAANAAKVAAEKRAISVLSTLRDIILQRDVLRIRKSAVDCAVGIASGRLRTSPSIHDKAMKLTINVLYPKNDTIADLVVNAVVSDIEQAASWAIENFDEIQKANTEEAQKKDTFVSNNNPLAARSDLEKLAIEKMKRPSVLIMALCVRRIELVQKLFQLSCQEKAVVLSKAVRLNMSKLATAISSKYGVAGAALQVANMTSSTETPMLLAFLDNLVSSLDRGLVSQEIIDACFQIQDLKLLDDGKRDPRYLIPIVSGMKRAELISRLPEFVAADDSIFLAAFVRMGDRLGRHALHFRDEPDAENPTLHGMTLCEQLVYLHRLDFNAAGLPQKRYLSAIKLCLEDDKIYSDQVLMSALDVMSGQFLTGEHKLPLAFMRTNILVCTKHESLHSWMCNVLLTRLVEGMIWNDPRQWEGWMRCAHMLEKSDDPTVSSIVAIEKLPPEQLSQYRSKWAKS